jgi:hypothetical protein
MLEEGIDRRFRDCCCPEAGVPALFEQLYSSVKTRRSKYHGSPANIGIGRNNGTEILLLKGVTS